MKRFKTVFVTVGTTKFDSLIKAVCAPEFLQALRDRGCTQLIIQYGRGDDRPVKSAPLDGIEVYGYNLKPSILEDIRRADLVISHAGAGSCLEILREQKPLIVVVNEELMGNHQTELAEQLYRDGNLFYCTPERLQDILLNCDFDELKPYQRGDMSKFVNQLDILMGFN